MKENEYPLPLLFRHAEERRRMDRRANWLVAVAAAIAAVASTGGAAASLDQAARLLPEHLEWRHYAPRRIRRAKGVR